MERFGSGVGISLLVAATALLTACSAAAPEPSATPSIAPSGTPTPTPLPTSTPEPSATPTATPTRTPRPTRAASATSAAAGPTGPAPDPVVLRLTLGAGEVYRIRTLTDQQISQKLEGQQLDLDQRVGYEYTYAVQSVDGSGNAWIDVVYTWVVVEQQTVMGTTLYDSSDPPEELPPGAEGYSALVGNGFSIQLSPYGEVLAIQGLDAFYAKMLDTLQLSDAALRAELEQLFREQFGEEALTGQLGGLTSYLTDQPVTIGDRWTTETEISTVMPMVIETDYAVTGLDDKTATLAVSSVISPNPEAGFMEFDIFQMGYSVEGEQSGEIRVDLASGLSSSLLSQDLSGEMILIAQGEELRVPISVQSVTQVEFIREE